jgi:Domain of unknown function (DUF4281)
MSASAVFGITNLIAIASWALLIAAVIFNRRFWRDELAGRWFPLGFSVLYAALIVFFFFRADGGFDTLENVQRLFTAPWVALAGWVHYLAFDLFMGAIISKRVMDQELPRWTLIALLPLTFMFGPIGFLGYEFVKLVFSKAGQTS